MNNLIVKMVRKVIGINLSIQLLISLGVAVGLGRFMSIEFQSFCYTMSLILKEILLFTLPMIVCIGLFSCFINIRSKRTLLVVLALFVIVCISNYFSTMIAYSIGLLKVTNIDLLVANESIKSILTPLLDFKLFKIISNQQGLILGMLIGAWFSFFPNETAYKLSKKLQYLACFFIEKLFIPLLPIFSFGLILKMQSDGVLDQIIQTSIPLIALIIGTSLIYLIVIFLMAAEFNFKEFIRYLKNIAPVVLMGFTTMSSLATMPVTLKAAEKNTNNKDIAHLVIPTTANIHLLGDSIAIPLVALSLLTGMGGDIPPFTIYSLFSLHFALAKFSVAAVPGGGILIMLPVLEQYLGFSEEMSNIITALYIVFDPIVTIINVLGNSALAILISKVTARITPKHLMFCKKYFDLIPKAKHILKNAFNF